MTDVEKKYNERMKDFDEILRENEKLEKELSKRIKVEDDMAVVLVEQPDRSINFGVIGVGQCGSKIAEEFYNRGYNCVAINTAMQDLKLINIPEKQKLFLDFSLGGAAKDLENGRQAAEEYADSILEMLEDNFADNEVLMLAVSGGGGSGSGSAETMVNIMSKLGKPISVIYVLPMHTEDALSKNNCVQTLSRLSQLASGDVINSLIVVDNAKIELLYPGLSVAEFWKTANRAIVEPLHLFNMLSSTPSKYTSLDPMDFSKIFVGTGDCALYGAMTVENYMEDEAIATAVIQNLENGLLASDFELKNARAAGIIITAGKEILEKIPSSSLEYGFSMVNKICSDGSQVFRGIYEVPGQNDLRVYSLFSGLGLPDERIKELKIEVERHVEALKNKENLRASNMNIDVGKTRTISAADSMYSKIKNKNSAMGKLKSSSKRIVDKRRK